MCSDIGSELEAGLDGKMQVDPCPWGEVKNLEIRDKLL